MISVSMFLPQAFYYGLIGCRVYDPHGYVRLELSELFAEFSIDDNVDLVRRSGHGFDS
jgi:hypothetical protein